MSNTMSYEQAISKLQEARISAKGEIKDIIVAKSEVLARFQPIFSEEHIPQLTEQEFHAFLLLENNQHWSGLHRSFGKIRADMALLRRVLEHLLDERNPIDERVDYAVNTVPGMGKAIVTAILQVVFPDKYGVWNNTSEGGLKSLDLWPIFERGESMGGRYTKINQTLLQLSKELNIDLWTLDALFWAPPIEEYGPRTETFSPIALESCQAHGFGLERHLQEFMVDNWGKMPLSQEWSIFSEPGDDEAGFEYPCDVGRIDILARHRTKPDWLIIELKRDQTSDATVGQVLRYMGWIKAKMADPGDEVHGLIIARQVDESILYALNATQNVDLQLYEVEFRLKNVPEAS